MPARPTQERLADIDAKMEQLKAQKRAILARDRAKERKERNHRLIRIGAEVEKYCGQITDLDAFAKYCEKYAYAIKRTQNTNLRSPGQNEQMECPSDTSIFIL